MLDRLMARLSEKHHGELDAEEVRISVAALLAAMERSDLEETPGEDIASDEALMVMFKIDRTAAIALLDKGKTAEDASVDTFQFTRLIKSTFDDDARAELLGELWRVAHADKVPTAREIAFIGKMAHLLDVSERAADLARRNVDLERKL